MKRQKGVGMGDQDMDVEVSTADEADGSRPMKRQKGDDMGDDGMGVECPFRPPGWRLARNVWWKGMETFCTHRISIVLEVLVSNNGSGGIGRCLKRFLEVLRFISVEFQLV
jgi:hypothetical protein